MPERCTTRPGKPKEAIRRRSAPVLRSSYCCRVLDQLATAGVDFEDVTGQLEREGLAKFEKSWNELSHTIAAELHRNHPARQS